MGGLKPSILVRSTAYQDETRLVESFAIMNSFSFWHTYFDAEATNTRTTGCNRYIISFLARYSFDDMTDRKLQFYHENVKKLGFQPFVDEAAHTAAAPAGAALAAWTSVVGRRTSKA